MIEQTIELENGLLIYFRRGLDGGGSTQRQDFIKALGKNKKKYFNRIFEWCSGPGYIGYNLLDQKMCEHVVFSDIHQLAINFVNKTAEKSQYRAVGLSCINVLSCKKIVKLPKTRIITKLTHCIASIFRCR
jgi:16S rRNA G1207 methylase RsmC